MALIRATETLKVTPSNVPSQAWTTVRAMADQVSLYNFMVLLPRDAWHARR